MSSITYTYYSYLLIQTERGIQVCPSFCIGAVDVIFIVATTVISYMIQSYSLQSLQLGLWSHWQMDPRLQLGMRHALLLHVVTLNSAEGKLSWA